ncbi:glycosyltransferase family 4 protein [Paludibaculum fermentans]|uniref:Glycosyltransferase family 4 protein n=1 Tax=Paludibaculum fermentans TaxID=1473598 RepID=A0A7S7NQ22_PALFE|nr:glycosyltransferase family 4 protein [Paludibaculum fermentans]QOY87687.1 glycosyltransferase family 4 protein [Paludibaculum fermentans]
MHRLLWVTEHYPPVKGGMAVSCARVVRGLRRRGLSVDLLALNGAHEPVEVRPTDGGADLRIRRDRSPEVAPNLAWSLVRERHLADPYSAIVSFGASKAGFVGTTFGAWLDLPSLVMVRGNDLDRDWFLPRRGGWVREALSRATAIGAVSTEKVERIARLYPGKCVLWTPNGVDSKRWELLAADVRRRDEVRSLLDAGHRRICGLFGELKFKKRIPFWLEAVRDAGLLSSIALLVVGQLDEDTTRILDDPAIAPRSLRLPFLPQAELPALYSACDFVAIPSAFEGMPNVLLEAAACGAVPLVSDAGAMRDVVEDGVTGFVFRAENRQAAGEATRRALELSSEQLAAMSAAVRARIRDRFSPEREIDTILDLIHRAAP